MSKTPHEPFAFHAWTPEASAVPLRPSWMSRARALSSRPPAETPPHVPSSLPSPPSSRPQEALESIVVMPPQASVDLTTSTALAELSDENAALRAQVAQMAATMAGLKRQVLEASEGELVKLALVIAERVVGRELAADPGLVAEWAQEAIDTLAAKDEVVIAVAKDIAQSVPDSAWDAISVEHRVQTDPQLVSGTIEVRTPEGIVETSADARMASVALALGVERP
jgi:hypothetical protein